MTMTEKDRKRTDAEQRGEAASKTKGTAQEKPEEQREAIGILARRVEFDPKKVGIKKLDTALLRGVMRHYRWPEDKKMTEAEFKAAVEKALKLPAHRF